MVTICPIWELIMVSEVLLFLGKLCNTRATESRLKHGKANFDIHKKTVSGKAASLPLCKIESLDRIFNLVIKILYNVGFLFIKVFK